LESESRNKGSAKKNAQKMRGVYADMDAKKRKRKGVGQLAAQGFDQSETYKGYKRDQARKENSQEGTNQSNS
jgi:hypothetical protein